MYCAFRNQLISDNNYEINREYICTYNEEGNITKREIKDIETNTTISIGFSKSLQLGIGGHIKIGFEISW